MSDPHTLQSLLSEVRSCRVCEAHLPLGPRPVVHMEHTARIVIIGQAPGTRVHQTGIPWNDPSGDHLREWMQISRKDFYDPGRIAIMPMGFCYPGKKGQGDAPPRPECAPTWHEALLSLLPHVTTTLLVGQYATKYYLGSAGKRTLTETVRAFRDYRPDFFPLPHPSWRSKAWIRKNPWFADDVLPALRALMSSGSECHSP